jgi:hypothetical protein
MADRPGEDYAAQAPAFAASRSQRWPNALEPSVRNMDGAVERKGLLHFAEERLQNDGLWFGNSMPAAGEMKTHLVKRMRGDICHAL